MQISLTDQITFQNLVNNNIKQEPKKGNIFISFSGGESSALMLLHCLEKFKECNILVCFANTGDEHEETLLFIKKIQEFYKIEIFWLEAYISPIIGKGVFPVMVDFNTASRDGTPLLDQAEKVGHSAISAPHCNRDLKVRMMHKFAKNYFKGERYTTMQGIRYDEKTRINWERAKKNNWDYPLARWLITKPVVNMFWKRHKEIFGWRLNLKEHQGNCNLCFKKSEKKLIKRIREEPCLIIFRITMELVSKNDNHDMYRKNMSAMDLFELAISKRKIESFSNFGSGCSCS